MGLKATRKIICTILAVLVSATTFFGSAFAISVNTFGNEEFYSKYWATDELVAQCEHELDTKFEALSYKSGIPLDVFNAVKRDTDTKTAITEAVNGIFSGKDTTLYSDERIDYFYNLCKVYLDANEYNYNKHDIKNVAEEATKIYSDSVGIHNTSSIKNYAEKQKEKSSVYATILLLMSLVGAIIFVVLHKEREQGIVYIASTLITSGIAHLITGMGAIIFGFTSRFDIQPTVYEGVFKHLHDVFMLYNVGCGLGLICVGVIVFAFAEAKIFATNRRKNYRYYKVVGKF